ncbi:MAG: tetratricopeptide repeat protein, partial [Albidovulum sp.]|nr:tetratricopeptide repeat protein [Albidovulum sp.]
DTPVEKVSSAYSMGLEAADSENWKLAVVHFTEAVRLEPDNADAFNMLAYSQRQIGDLESAFSNYEMALAIDPRHEEALEYLGEAYLLVDDLDSAVVQLEKLDEICDGDCEAYFELRDAIEEFRAARGSD